MRHVREEATVENEFIEYLPWVLDNNSDPEMKTIEILPPDENYYWITIYCDSGHINAHWTVGDGYIGGDFGHGSVNREIIRGNSLGFVCRGMYISLEGEDISYARGRYTIVPHDGPG
ncbi:MAG: hypothetical protein JWN90_143 [Parcubacteria group bacterium]|nr:hypothetical protein [Parcubacteria group bacterium]